LSIDDLTWPFGELSQLLNVGQPYPNWQTDTVYQSLVDDNASLEYSTGAIVAEPMLASNWTVSADGRTYTFDLRNATFSNGDPFNAYQVWAEMYADYYLSGNSSNWMTAYNVFNMSSVDFGLATLALLNQSSVVKPSAQGIALMSNSSWPIYAPNADQIVFHLAAQFQWFPLTLVVFTGLLYDVQFVLDHGGYGTLTAVNPYFNLNPAPGTGPYMVSGVAVNSYVEFTQNPTYWGQSLTPAQIQANPYLDPGHVKNVIIYAKTDDVARYADLASGSVQIAGIETEDWPLIQANPAKFGYSVLPDNSMAFVGATMNTLRYPTNITAVRQAIVHAINYSNISQQVFFNGLVPFMGPEYPSQSQYYDLGNLSPYQYNVTLAEQILKNASINAASLPVIEFRVEAGCNFCVSAAEIIQGDLSQIGLNINIEVTPSSEYTLPYVAAGAYSGAVPVAQQVAQMTWFGSETWAPDEPTPADSWILFVSNQSVAGNYAIYSNPTVQQCVNSWTDGASNSTLISLCTAAQKQIYNDAPYIWLGTIKLPLGGGSVVWDKNVVASAYLDPLFTGQTETVIFNTVTFVNGQD
jgi:ABC-type transport system substrate-binding protein